MPKITINNQQVEVEPGTTLIHAIRDLGIEVPTLCYWEGVSPMNSCMLCVVREARTGNLLPSCSSLAQEGMVIETDSGDVCQARKEVLELIVSEHVGDCEAPCSHTCPASMNIPVMMRQIYEGHFDEAAFTVHNGLVFPWTLGYICPAPCQNPCRRKSYDTTMEIRELHKTVASKSVFNNPELLDVPAPTGKRVAVVGAGITGMAAAWVIRKFGHECTIFEKEPIAGGKMRFMTEDELPKHVLDSEIDLIAKLGIEFRYNAPIDNNGGFAKLQEEYDAVILACNGVGQAGGKVFEAKEHRLHVRAVGNGKTTALWVDRYLRAMEKAEKPLFHSKIGKMVKDELEIMRVENENKESMDIVRRPDESDLTAAQTEAGRCLHCDCRKRVSCGLRKWSTEYGVERNKYNTTEPLDYRILGTGDIVFEPGKCIKCGLCVAIARKYGEEIGLAFSGRGFDVEIVVPFGLTLDEAMKNSAEECVLACPTAAISFRNKEDIEACHTTTWIEV